MSVAHCLDRLRTGYGIEAGPDAITFSKAQIVTGMSLPACRRHDGRETHFVIVNGRPVLAVWDAVSQLVVTYLRLNVDPARLLAFLAGMQASTARPPMTAIAANQTATLAEHDQLVADARANGGWSGEVMAAWAGVTAREAGLSIACPFTDDEPALAHRWRAAYGQGRHAGVPTADVIPLRPAAWAPKPGITHAARCVATED